MWKTWKGQDRSIVNAFIHFTLDAGKHPLLERFHSNDENRGLAILGPEHYDNWLSSTRPEVARAPDELFPADDMDARPGPTESTAQGDKDELLAKSVTPAQATPIYQSYCKSRK